MLRASLIAVLLSLLPSIAAANEECKDKCLSYLREGFLLNSQGKYSEALDKFKQAHDVTPRASLPVSAGATVLFELSKVVPADQVEKVRAMSRSSAELARHLNPDDPFAYDTLRKLDNDLPPPLKEVTNPAAQNLFFEAEILFSKGLYDDAFKKYQQVLEIDPDVSHVWVTAGNTHYMQGDFVKAETFFRRATVLEPRNSQAWRFLADALMNQRKVNEAEQAILSAIAADPAQIPNWTKLGQLRAASGLPLKRFHVKRPRITESPPGKYEVAVDEADQGTADGAFRLALAMGEIAARKSDHKLSRFEIEKLAWRTALASQAPEGARLTDPALLQMQQMDKDGQLDAAILILLFKQAYRPDLERWLTANPVGINKFIYRYGMRP